MALALEIFQIDTIVFTLLMLIDVFTLYIFLNQHIVFILFSIVHILSHIWYAYYIAYNIYTTP
jgi:hypothetical protein